MVFFFVLQEIPKITRIKTYGEDEGKTPFVFLYLYIQQESDLARIKVGLVTHKKTQTKPLCIFVEVLHVQITRCQWDKAFTIQPRTAVGLPRNQCAFPTQQKKAGKHELQSQGEVLKNQHTTPCKNHYINVYELLLSLYLCTKHLAYLRGRSRSVASGGSSLGRREHGGGSLQPCKGRVDFLGQAGRQRHKTSHKTWFICSKLWAWQSEEEQALAEVNGVLSRRSFAQIQEGPQASTLQKSRTFNSRRSSPRAGRDRRAAGRQAKCKILWTN